MTDRLLSTRELAEQRRAEVEQDRVGRVDEGAEGVVVDQEHDGIVARSTSPSTSSAASGAE